MENDTIMIPVAPKFSMPIRRVLRRIARVMDRLLPKDHGAAVVIVTAGGQVACHHNMEPVKLAIVLGKLTEDLVREAKQPIFEGVKNGTEQKEG